MERLAFSVVWRMKKDGTLPEGERAWYGRSVIRSCAKLDYATAQRLVDAGALRCAALGCVARVHCMQPCTAVLHTAQPTKPHPPIPIPIPSTDDLPGENENDVPAALEWEPARRPPAASGISCRAVQADVKLLQSVAMARRVRRFAEGGALALNRCKLSFRLDADGNPAAFAEYPIRDSNRCVCARMRLLVWRLTD